MKKRQKLPKIGSDDKESLAKIAASKEFLAFTRMSAIEEHNIVIQSFKVNSSDPDIARKKAWMEGRIYELRKILKTFEASKKEEEKNE